MHRSPSAASGFEIGVLGSQYGCASRELSARRIELLFVRPRFMVDPAHWNLAVSKRVREWADELSFFGPIGDCEDDFGEHATKLGSQRVVEDLGDHVSAVAKRAATPRSQNNGAMILFGGNA